MRYWISDKDKYLIVELYKHGNSSQEIKEILQLQYNVRSIQRYIKSQGLSRTVGESFRLAVKKGRVDYKARTSR